MKLHGPEHVAMVGDSQSRHTVVMSDLYGILYLAGPVQKAVVGMQMKMNKWSMVLVSYIFLIIILGKAL